MRKLKKVIAAATAIAMVASMAACSSNPASNQGDESAQTNGGNAVTAEDTKVTVPGSDWEYTKKGDMTTEDIELVYFTFDSEGTANYLAKRFMEIYPNIKVTVATAGTDNDYMQTLATQMQTNQMPDIIMYTDADTALYNTYLGDITEYWNADPETANLVDTMASAHLGQFETGHQLAVPIRFFPGIMFIDRNVFEILNVELPTQSWTWGEMIDLIKKTTLTDSPDGMTYYGYGFFNRLDSYYGIASSQDIVGEFGFNGKTFDLSMWAVGEQEFADLRQAGYVTPNLSTPENLKWTGSMDTWMGSTGHVAILGEAFWTYQNIWATEAYQQTTMDIVPYVIPAVSEEDASSDHHSIAYMDFGGISNTTEHPREAYELLKFMSFGIDGWMTRIELYSDETQVNASGVPYKKEMMPVPLTKDETVWNAYIDMYCSEMDEEHEELWRQYFKTCLQPIPFGWENIAGYFTFCADYFNKIDIHTVVDLGQKKAADYAPEATEKANYYHADAMLRYFGPDSDYNFLSDEDVAYYQNIIDNNGAVD